MTIKETFDNLNVIEEGKIMNAIGGAAFALILATAAGLPQKAMLKHDINKIVKTMEPVGQSKFKQLYQMDEQNGTNRAGSYLLSYIENEVEEGTNNKDMQKIYKEVHGTLPEMPGREKRVKDELAKSGKVGYDDFKSLSQRKNFKY